MPEDKSEELRESEGVSGKKSGDKQVPEIAQPSGTPPSNVPSKTTPEEDRETFGQRRINLVWEATQAVVALIITITSCVVVIIRAMNPSIAPSDNGPFMLLASAFSFVIGTYFTRTNHTKTGGIGATEGKTR